MTKKWYEQKTTWSGIAMLIAAAGGYYTHTMTTPDAIQAALAGLGIIFLRQGVENAKQ